MPGDEAERWGFFNRLALPANLRSEAVELAHSLASGPTVAHSITKKCLHEEWNMSIDDAIAAEAQAQAACMKTADFERAYQAFVKRETPVFQGN